MGKQARKESVNERQKHDDIFMRRIFIAFAVAVVSIFCLMMIYKYYQLSNYVVFVYQTLKFMTGLFAGLFVGSAVFFLAVRKRSERMRRVALGAAVACAVLSLSFLFMVTYSLDAVLLLCYLYPGGAVMYLIYHIYQKEFFIVTLLSVFTGVLLFFLSRTLGSYVWTSSQAILSGALYIFIIACCVLAVYLRRRKGELKAFGNPVRFPAVSKGYAGIFASCTVSAAALTAALTAGASVAYYCMFAMIAYLLAAAVYYTIKLM